MKKRIGVLAVLGLPVIALATLLAAAPVFADTPGQGAACVPQSVDPHPTDPAGATTATLFCTTPTPSPSPAAGTGPRSGGSGGRSASAGPGVSGAGTTGGGSPTTLANSTGSGTPDE